MGIKDMSVIDTPPENRIPVATKVAEFDERAIKEGITRELKRGGQVFFVNNRIHAQEMSSGADLSVLISKLDQILNNQKTILSQLSIIKIRVTQSQ